MFGGAPKPFPRTAPADAFSLVSEDLAAMTHEIHAELEEELTTCMSSLSLLRGDLIAGFNSNLQCRRLVDLFINYYQRKSTFPGQSCIHLDECSELADMSKYYFDGNGKSVRPAIAMILARAFNAHVGNTDSDVLAQQRKVAIVTEMIHTASLVSGGRRRKWSANENHHFLLEGAR